MHLPDPVFPPLLAGHSVKAPQRPFEHACRQAADGALGAGDLVWGRGVNRAECAIVLEPEVDLPAALQMNTLAQVALADCLGSLLPPVVAIHHRWPGTILINGGAAGTVRLGVPAAAPDAVPDWLVVGMSVQLIHDRAGKEPGELPDQTALDQEGGGEITRTGLLQSFAAYFLLWHNTWQNNGFRPVHQSWMARIEGDGEAPMQVELNGSRRAVRVLGLDEEGNLIIKPDKGPVQALPLLDTLVSYRREPAR